MKTLTPRRQAYKKEIVLISHGFSDPVAWPGGKLTVYPWDSEIDEYLIDQAKKTNRQRLVFGLLNKLCDLNGGKVENFVADEVNTVMLVSRALSTDSVVQYTAQCPMCAHKRTEQIKVPDELVKVGEKTEDYVGYDDITLPVCKDIVRIRPLLVKDEQIIEDRSQDQKKEVSDTRLKLLMPVITINGGKPDMLSELVNYASALHPRDAKFLEDEQKRLSPHLNTNLLHVCDECGKEFSHLLTFDQEFFR